LLLLLLSTSALAQSCPQDNPLRSTGTLNLRIDNDMFGGIGQDQGYSNGFLVSWVSPNLVDYRDDPCLPRLVRGLNRFLTVLQPEGFDEQNMTIGFGQMMYTPSDKTRSDLIKVSAKSEYPGMPPERYIITYQCKGVIGMDRRGNPKIGEKHQVEIYLHSQYPQRWPGMKWLTPIWHPNINHANGSVCIDAAWWSASRSLDRLVIMLGEMVQYKNFHDDPSKPPFPWDMEAASWSRQYRKTHPNFFPVDTRELMRPERIKLTKPTTKAKPKIKLK
jgi:hypothetical protein